MKLVGLAASPGTVQGRVLWMNRTSKDPSSPFETLSLTTLRERSLRTLEDLKLASDSPILRDVLQAQLLMAEDPLLWDAIAERLATGIPLTDAIRQSIDMIAEQFSKMDDPYIAGRADDIRDVGQHILAQCESTPPAQLWPATEPRILVSDTLFPSDTAKIDLTRVSAIVLSQGSLTSHVTILARSLQIPAVIAGDIRRWLHDDDVITVDGFHGIVTDEPPRPSVATAPPSRSAPIVHHMVYTKDGIAIRVEANVGSIKDAQEAKFYGADGIGLLRTEFFFGGDHFPSEDEQYAMLRAIAQEAPKSHPITVRAADIGGDKPLSYMDLPNDPNPFLGTRALRLLDRYPDLYLHQLRAVLRVSQEFPIRLMFPMIATIDDWFRCEAELQRALVSLNMPSCPIPVGIMVEVPSAVFLAPELARHAQFFSVGTNDLIQYLFAADRSVSALGSYYRPGDPALVRALRQIFNAATNAAIPVGLCGEMAGDTEYTALLLALGLREFSVSAPLVPVLKSLITTLAIADCQISYREMLEPHSA